MKVGMEDFGGVENGVGENEGPRIVLNNVDVKKEWYETGFCRALWNMWGLWEEWQVRQVKQAVWLGMGRGGVLGNTCWI